MRPESMRGGKTTVATVALAIAIAGALCFHRSGSAQQQSPLAPQENGDAGGQSQQTADQTRGTTTLKVYSRLTVVDVTATDGNGHPVQGLQQSDFTILEDRKPQPIRNFEEVTEAGVPQPPALPPHTYTNLQPENASAAVNILLLDFANEAPVDSTNLRQMSRSVDTQNRVKQAAMEAIGRMPAGTRIAVLAMTNHLRVLEGFTTNQEVLKAAIGTVSYDLDGNGNGGGVQADMRNRMVLETFDQIAVDVAQVKGRKNLIWFTTGIPEITDPNHRGSGPDYSKPLSQMYDALTDAQISVYPVDVGGAGRLGERQLSMQQVAETTGGIAYTENNDMASGMLKAIDNGANYYSIAYVPPNPKYNGDYHAISVKVDRPGVNLVFRRGYYADEPSKHVMQAGLTLSLTPPPVSGGNMKAAMSRGMPVSQDLLFDVGVEPSTVPPKPGDPPIMGTLDPKLKGKHLTRYGFTYVVPAEQIKFKDGPGGKHTGKIEFDIAVYDADEKLLTGLSQTVTLPLSDGSYQQMLKIHGPVRFFEQIDLPPGQLFVRTGVLDTATAKVGTLELPLTVAKK
jgi:VWFA-related protein